MKKITLFIIFAIIGTAGFCQDNKNIYASKSGKIAYRYELNGIETSYLLVFDGYGNKQAVEFTLVENGIQTKTKTIITPENIFVVNYEDEQVIKFPVDTDDQSMEMMGAGGGFDFGSLAAEVTGNATGKKGTGTILGKPCDIFELTDEGAKGKFWIYNGYLLKGEFIDENGQHAYMEATEFNVDVSIANSEFAIPNNFEVQDMTQMMEQMKQMQQMYGAPDNE